MVSATDPHARVLGFVDRVSKIFTDIGDVIKLYLNLSQ
jgi:hypothetical protein